MIPEKIYLQYYGYYDPSIDTDCKPEQDLSDVSWCANKIYEHDIEYTLSPTIKRFSDELPKDRQYIGWKYIDGLDWGFMSWREGFSQVEWKGEAIWFPVILPEESK